MRWRRIIWPLLGATALTGAIFWWNGQHSRSFQHALPSSSPIALAKPRTAQIPKSPRVTGQITQQTFQLLSQPSSPTPPLPVAAAKPDERFKYRLNNTSQTVSQLAHNNKAILLENALFDTAASFDNLNIPQSLTSSGEPGAYIVQSKTALDDKFRWEIKQAGAAIVSYIPNNAYLVRATEAVAQQLAGLPQTQVVLPYEPYYKLKSSLLPMALEQHPLPDGGGLNLLVFSDARSTTLTDLDKMNVKVVSEEKSPFGQVLHIKPPAEGWTELARLPGVQVMELSRSRVRANDLSRFSVGVATNTTTVSNYLGLTGKGILVNVNDSGVDITHPDLAPRVTTDFPNTGIDPDSHGTFVAGIIASSGDHSDTVTNASGSIMPPTNGQFRGMAPEANIFAMSIDAAFGIGGAENSFGPIFSDQYLQETAAVTNALISNNSWHYGGDNEYDLAAASYDAAVRDALPGTMGSQPITYVFSAGNAGDGDDGGSGGSPGEVYSPATAKNVISVGAVEQLRNITNKTVICRPDSSSTNANGLSCNTNTPWLGMTDSSNQVASFSSRGNVGVNVEGDFGRFKPDLVAPGTFVVSTTEKDHWDQASYYNPTNYHFDTIPDQEVETNMLDPFLIFVPYNAVQMVIRVFAPEDLRIYVKQSDIPTTNSYDVLGTNVVSLPPDHALSPTDAGWFYAIQCLGDHPVQFTIETELVTTNDLGDYLTVLSNMNNTLGPYYRYESGTSMSAADVSGMLALVKQWFEQLAPTPHTNSPALMKALLINGSRSLDARYDFAINEKINLQGWGLPNLQLALPTNSAAFTAATGQGSSMFFFDQDPTNALATGQSRTYHIKVDPLATPNPLRVTLVWTDPPGNPVASTKLVNDLDLVVTNLDTGDIFFGNDIPAGANFNLPTDTNSLPILDVINNVENVFLSPDLGTNYSVTVIGKRVNVNAVTAQTNDVVQDFALVISSGDGEVSNALQIVEAPATVATNLPLVTIMTNSFPNDPHTFGGMVLHQHVGANSPLLGTNTLPLPQYGGQLTIGVTNQWHFYVITNSSAANFTNAAFLTFLPPTLSEPRMGVYETDPNNASRFEGDIDLYVSTDSSLTNLNPVALASATKSLSRGGTETIVLSNAQPSQAYYIGVKSEDHEAGEYNFLGVFSDLPFGTGDQEGNLHLRGFPANALIPDGTPANPGGVYIFAVAPSQITVRRVIATNTITHSLMTDLFGKLNHGEDFAVLNNHSGPGPVTNQTFIYNDSGQRVTSPVVTVQRADGPGSLRNFAAKEGVGQWMLTMIDNAPGHIGTNVQFSLFLEKQQDLLNGAIIDLAGGECSEDFIYVPVEATNLTVYGNLLSGTGPVQMDVCPIDASGPDCQTTIIGLGGTNSVTIDKSSNPPLNPGWYVVRLCNMDPVGPVSVRILATLGLDIKGVTPTIYPAGGPLTILDDAVSASTISVTNTEKIVSVEVGVRIDHPRVSDLVLTLVGPDGSRALLAENRGDFTTNGMGLDQFATNVIPVNSNGGPEVKTNSIDTGVNSGTIQIDYDFYQIPDRMVVYYGGSIIWDSGLISGAGSITIPYGPGASTVVTIVMNPGGNSNQGTRWTYTVTSTVAKYYYATFTEDTNKTTTPVKFAIPPFLPRTVNVVHWRNGFENGDPGVHVSGSTFAGGWRADTGDITVLTNGYNGGAQAYEGSRFVELSGTNPPPPGPFPAAISTNVPTVPGGNYVLSFAAAANPDNTANGPINLLINGSLAQTFNVGVNPNGWTNLNWAVLSYGFRATASSTLIQFAGTDGTNGPLLDLVTLSETSSNLYLLPEDPLGLNKFVKMPAIGDWKLEVWDNRAGAFPSNPAPTLRSWALSFLFETPIPTPVGLVDDNGSTNTINPGQVKYFDVPVPYWASFATNTMTILSTTPPGPNNLDLWFNQVQKPVPASPPDTRLFSVTGPNGTSNSITLSNTSTPQLRPGQTYHLAVTNSGGSTVTFSIQVNFDVTPLTLDVPISSTEFTNSVPRYFSYDVATNETGISVQLTNLNGNVDLVARLTPFPDLGIFDYGSFNAGTNWEDIVIYTNSEPVPLGPGHWYFGVFNRDVTNVDYTIVVTHITGALPGIIDLTNAVAYTNNNTGLGIPNDYYRFVVTNPVARAQFEINNPTADMSLVVRKGLPPPDLGSHDYMSANPGLNDELIVLHDYSRPIPISPGDWYLTAVNVSGGPATYSIKATQWPVEGTNSPITGVGIVGSCFNITWTSLAGVHYVIQGKANLFDPNWDDVSPTITATSGTTSYCFPLPSTYHFFRIREGLSGTGATMPIPPPP